MSPRWLMWSGVFLVRIAQAQFLPTGSGPFDYADPGNWAGRNINGVFNQTLTADQTILLPSGFDAAPTFTFGGLFDLTLRGNSAAPANLHLVGSLTLDSLAGGRTVYIGSATAENRVGVSVDPGVRFLVADSDSLVLWNSVAGAKMATSGAGTVFLRGTNTYTGGADVYGGILDVVADANLGAIPAVPTINLFLGGDPFLPGVLRLAASFDIQANRSLQLNSFGGAIDTNGFNTTYAGVISGGGGGNRFFEKRGAGELRLTGAGTYSGSTTVRGGTLAWDYTSNNASKLDPAGDIILRESGTLALIGSAHAPTMQAIDRITVAGSTAIRLTNGAGQSVLLDSANFTRESGTLDLTLPASGGLRVSAPDITGVLGYATVDGSDWAMRDAAGYLVRLAVYDRDSLADGANADLTTHQNLAASTTISSLRFHTPAAAGVALATGTRLTVGASGRSGGLLVTGNVGANSVAITGGELTASATDLVVIQNNPAQPLTIGSRIVDSAGAIRLTKAGPGVLILEDANTFTGGTMITAGTLRLGGAGRLPAVGEVYLEAGTTLDFNGISQTVGGLGGVRGSAVVLGGGTLTFGSNNFIYEFGGTISGVGGVRKIGTSTQSFQNPQAYSGATTIDGGFISLGGDESLPTTTALTFGNGTLQVGLRLNGRSQTVGNLSTTFAGAAIFGPGTLTVGSGDGSYAGAFSSGVNLVKDGLGTTTVLAGNNTNARLILRAGTIGIATTPASLTFEGGTLQLRANISALVTPGAVAFTSSEALIDTNGFNATIPAAISGPGGLTKLGAGTLSVTGANTFSGGVRVNGGILAVSNSSALGAAANTVQLDSGTLSAQGSISRNILLGANGGGLAGTNIATFSGLISGAGRLDVNSGAVTLTAQNLYAGGTRVGNVGALLASGANRVFGSGPVQVQPGGLVGIAAPTNLAPGVLVPLQSGAVVAVLEAALDPAALIDSDPANTTGGILALGVATYDRPLDLAAIGNGKLFLGAFGAARYAPATLGANVDGIYRLGASSAIGTSVRPFGIPENVLTIGGTDHVLTGPNAVLVGDVNAPANGTVVLLNANDFSGGTTLARGTLGVGHAHALGTGPLTISGGTLQARATVAIDNPVFVTGNFSVMNVAGFLNLTGPVDLGGATRTLTFGGESPLLRISGRISNGGLVKLGGGILDLAAANHYAGGTTVAAGILRSSAQGALGSGTLFIDGGAVIFAGAAQSVSNPISVLRSSTGMTFDVPTTVSGQISAGSAGLKVFNLAGMAAATIDGAITDGIGSLGLRKLHAGVTILNGVNSFSGGLRIFEGAIVASSDANLGTPSDAAGNLVFSGGTLRYGAAFALNSTRSITLETTSTSVSTIDTNGFDVPINNAMSGMGRLVKGGTGKLTLGGFNTFTGGITINAGVLQFSNPAATSIGPITIATAGAVAIASVNQTFLNKLVKSSTGVVALARDEASTLDFTGANWRLGAIGEFRFTGALTPNGTMYRLGGGGGRLTLPNGTLTGGRSLEVDTAPLGGSVMLAASHSYSGATTIQSGTLALSALGALPNTASITIASGAVFDVSAITAGFTLGSGKMLLGAGAVRGRFTLATGATVSPGVATAPFGQLALQNFTLRGNYVADIDTTGLHDRLAIDGNLDLSSATDSLTVNATGAPNGEYILATYSGVLSGTFDTVMLPAGTSLDYGTGANSQIRLIPEPNAFLLLPSALFLASLRRRYGLCDR